MRERFDLDALDPDDPFELDDGRGDPRRCRPIGIYEPSGAMVERYEEDSRL